MTRRTFVAGASAAAVTAPAVVLRASATFSASYVFFTASEARFVESACARLIAHGTKPLNGGVELATYLDGHLASAWGQGEQLYRTGPWQPGSAICGHAAATPASLFRRALASIDLDFQTRRTCFGALGSEAQRAFLEGLATGGSWLGDVPSAVFFDLLLGMTVEGFLTDSRFESHRALIAWPVKGFPGAYFRHKCV